MDRRSWIKALVGASVGSVAQGNPRDYSNLLQDQVADANATRPFTGVFTRSFNNQRTCSTSTETVLSPASIQSRGLKQYWSAAIPDDRRGAEAQPLTVPSVKLPDGSTRSLLTVATMGNWIRTFDARDGMPVWAKNYGRPINNSPKIDMYSINDHWGICGTPAIDPVAGMIYFVTWSSPDGVYSNGKHTVHGARITDGVEPKPAIDLSDLTYAGLRFGDQMRKQRSSMAMSSVRDRNTIFFGCGSVLETSKGATGWLIAIDTDSWSVGATWSAAVKTFGGGIWMAGQGVAVANDGDIYFATGNGGFDGITELGESFVRLRYWPPAISTPGLLKVMDHFTPYTDSGRAGQDPRAIVPREAFGPRAIGTGGKLSGTNQATMQFDRPVNAMSHAHVTVEQAAQPSIKLGPIYDQDLGSGGVGIIESLNLVIGAGKDGILYAVRKDKMGQTMPDDLADPAANYAKLPIKPFWYTFYPGKDPATNLDYDAAPKDPTQLNRLFFGRTHHMHGSSPVYEGTSGTYVYCWGENGNPRAWLIRKDSIRYVGCGEDVASSQSPVPPGGMPGGMMCVSSNGKDDESAILWAVAPFGDANKRVTNGRIRAYRAAKFGKYSDGSPSLIKVWESEDISYNKFNVPIVDGGRLYYATYDGRIICVGLR